MKHFSILCAVLIGFAFLARETAYFGPYTYDEADYMHALRGGWWSNWTDTPTMPLSEMIHIGMSRGRDRTQRGELSEVIRESKDVLFYRHWHGPLYTAWLGFTHLFAPAERTMRAWTNAFAIATAGMIYFGALRLLPGAAGQIAAILGAVLYLWSYSVVRSTELAPHQWFAATEATALLLLAGMWHDQESARARWYGAVVMSAIAFCLLEVAFALILTLLVCGFVARRQLQAGWRFIATSLALFAASVFVMWPGAFVKLSFVKSYLFMAYLAVFRKDSWGPGVSFAQTWRLRLEESPVLWILFLAAMVWFAFNRKKFPMLLPFASFSVLMFLAIARVNTDQSRYLLPLLPGLVLMAAFATGIVLSDSRPAPRIAGVTLLCAAIYASSWGPARARMPVPYYHADAMLALIGQNAPAGKTLLIPFEDLPMVHYYFPDAHLKSYYDEAGIPEILHSQSVDAVVSRGNPPRFTAVERAADR